jgi:hypothetical protein
MTLYARKFRAALRVSTPPPTLSEIAEWTGFSKWTLAAWLTRPTARSHRVMPKSAARLIVYELHFRQRLSEDSFLSLLR